MLKIGYFIKNAQGLNTIAPIYFKASTWMVSIKESDF